MRGKLEAAIGEDDTVPSARLEQSVVPVEIEALPLMVAAAGHLEAREWRSRWPDVTRQIDGARTHAGRESSRIVPVDRFLGTRTDRSQ